MKKTPKTKPSDDLLPEYRFDYRKAKSNRFAARLNPEQLTITLDPDVSEVFKTSESVNKALRALISAIPEPVSKRRRVVNVKKKIA
ncbi:MAG: hypothetical protein AB1757_26005 [Acidobacteriota bacterium]